MSKKGIDTVNNRERFIRRALKNNDTSINERDARDYFRCPMEKMRLNYVYSEGYGCEMWQQDVFWRDGKDE